MTWPPMRSPARAAQSGGHTPPAWCAVVATLTERQQQMYQPRFVQELTGGQAMVREITRPHYGPATPVRLWAGR